MHVLIIPAWYPQANAINGIFFREQAEDLAKEGITVSVAAAEVNTKTPWRAQFTASQENGLFVVRSFRKNRTPFWESGVQYQKRGLLERSLQQIEAHAGPVDLIHMESARIANPVIALAKKHHLPFTFTEHFSQILQSKPGSPFFRVLQRAASQAERVFAISSVVEEKLLDAGCAPQKIVRIPNSVRFSSFSLQKEFPSAPVFRVLGSLRRIKGYDLLLSAFAKVHTQVPSSRLVIGGEGEEREALEKQAQSLGISTAVHFFGKVDRKAVPSFLQGTSCFLCTSRLETFSIVLVEALATGLPLIATDCGGPSDIVTSENGILVPKENPNALADAMLHFLAEEKKCSLEQKKKKAQGRRDAAKQLYSSRFVAEKKISQWREILG